jgi:hypothetical protein
MDASVASVVVAAIAAVGTVIAARLAHRAERNTRPTSNGFAGETIRRLERIEGLIVGHLEDHAEHDLRTRRQSRP